MLIYIIHSDRIFTFRLPKTVSGNYVLFDYDTNGIKRSLVNIYAYNDEKWFMKSNEDMQIFYNGQYAENIELKEYNFYSLNVYKTENLLLYISPALEKGYIGKTLSQDTCTLTVGKEGCDIVYSFPSIAEKQVELTYQNGYWSYKNLNVQVPVYVNKANKTSARLSNLDTLFIMGLKIVVCGKTIFIKSPLDNAYFFNNKLTDEIAYLSERDREIHNEVYKDFYETNEYFNKSPIFRKKINTLHLTITSPNEKDRTDEGSLLLQIVPSGLMSLTSVLQAYYSIQSYQKGESNKETIVTSLVMCVVMLIVSILWPFVERFASKIRRTVVERRRIHVYTKYLKKKRKVLEASRNEQKMTLEFNNVSLEQCADIIQNRTSALFSRGIEQDDFLSVRLGKGRVLLDCEINYDKPDFVQSKDKLLDDIDQLLDEFKYVNDVPFSISLNKEKSLAFINNAKNYTSYMNAILLQLLTFHDYANLKLVILTSDTSSNLMKLKNLNHCWDNDKSMRFFATNLQDAENISTYLVRIFNQRSANNKSNDNSKKGKIPFYLIISDHIEMYRNLKIVENVLDNSDDIGFGIMMFGQKLTDIPDGCDNFIDYNEKQASIFKAEMEEKNIHNFTPEFLSDAIDFNYYVKLINNIPIQVTKDQQGSLPTRLGFLEMYGVGKIEQLNILNRWKNSNVTTTLAAPIGVDSKGNIISLDLHETKHGPHGLIAGMTGSGKSEFIITYILSLAVNYSPDEVQFVLIDYKGGGLAGAFENRKTRMKLPHLVGTITNLDKSEMNRTLVSINSELQRRQRIFNEAKEKLDTGNMDIYKYQKLHREGTLEEPLSHLFIICDEFAELKSQQPDFMDELVSTARIGRSLGIHLILATQKPSGVVDEQIWSNSRFKVCCKVQTTDDSNEMIQRPDAAYLKDSGRFFLQIGYDEFFTEGQSGYSGIAYTPTETVTSKIDNSISFISNIGENYKSIDNKQGQSTKKKEDLGEELINILKYIIDVANQEHFTYQQLWLDSLPQNVYYDTIVKKYNVLPTLYDIDPVIGEYDDPKNQKQDYVHLPITTEGNAYLVGASGSGKSTLLSTLIYSSIINHNAEEVQFYIVDFGTEKLRKFQKAPQVGDVLTIADGNKITYLFYMLEAEKSKRQKYYAENGSDFLTDVKQHKSPFANIIVIIYDIEVFKEVYQDLYDEKFVPFTRNCSKFGIYFIVTSTSTSSLGFMAENNFPQKIMLNMVDITDYAMYFDKPPIPNKTPGRGLIQIDEPYEFQVPLITSEEEEPKVLSYVIEQLDKFLVKKAPPVPFVPQEVSLSDIKNYITTLKQIPIGINIQTAQPGYFNLEKSITVISSSRVKDVIPFFNFFITMCSSLENVNIIVLNALKDMDLDIPEKVKFYDGGFAKIMPVLEKNVIKYNEQGQSPNRFMIIVLGYEELSKHIGELNNEETSIINIGELVDLAKKNESFKFVLYDTASMCDELKNGDISNLVDLSSGIWIGRGFDSQNILDAPDAYNDNVKMTNDIAVLVKNGQSEYVKFVKKI